MGAALSRKNLELQDAAGGTAEQLPGFAGLDVSFRDKTVYDDSARAFMTAIVFASALSLVSVLLMWILALASRGPAKTAKTNLLSFVNCLLLANGIQAISSLFSTQWVVQGAVTSGTLCSFQGAIKQAGNVGAAVWSFMLSVHAFNLLFMRITVTNVAKWTMIFVGWFVVIFVVIIGPTAIQNKEHGPYFSVSGYWCWITEEYPAEQAFLEYFIEWLSAFLSILLYTCILLRVRGNFYRRDNGKWGLRFVSRSDSWKLAMGRDILDTVMVRVAAVIVWYPVAYTILIFPISVARFSFYAAAHVPAWATFICDLIFSLSGFANLMLALVTSRLLPDMNDLPTFATQREAAPPPNGITPFMFTSTDARSVAIALTPGTHSVSHATAAEKQPNEQMLPEAFTTMVKEIDMQLEAQVQAQRVREHASPFPPAGPDRQSSVLDSYARGEDGQRSESLSSRASSSIASFYSRSDLMPKEGNQGLLPAYGRSF